VHAELPKSVYFDAYSQFAREEDVAQLFPCGSGADGIVEGVKQFVDARFDRVALERYGTSAYEVRPETQPETLITAPEVQYLIFCQTEAAS
jgi:hypothetical protein